MVDFLVLIEQTNPYMSDAVAVTGCVAGTLFYLGEAQCILNAHQLPSLFVIHPIDYLVPEMLDLHLAIH